MSAPSAATVRKDSGLRREPSTLRRKAWNTPAPRVITRLGASQNVENTRITSNWAAAKA